MADIQYNFINLPSRIEFENGHVISYLYDADGIKLRTTHIIGSDTTVTDYCGNVIYENGIPVKLLTEAGYVTLADSKYHYFVQDHLGNNRVVVDQSGNVEEVNHYYPFGGLLSSSVSNAVQPYKYNGKELDRKNGLDWYDYGACMYDAALGRWHAVDPMSEKYYSWSPYTYCKNNPVLRIDLDGKDDYVISRSGRLFNETPIDKRGKGSTDNLYLSSDRSISVTVNQGLLGEIHSMQAKEQKENRVKKSYGSTQDLETAATVFKFAAVTLPHQHLADLILILRNILLHVQGILDIHIYILTILIGHNPVALTLCQKQSSLSTHNRGIHSVLTGRAASPLHVS